MELEDFLEKCFGNWKRVLKFSIYYWNNNSNNSCKKCLLCFRTGTSNYNSIW